MTVRIPVDAAPDTDLVDLLDRDVLEAHAGWLIYERGADYTEQDYVADLEVSADRATAVVHGTLPYHVAVERDTSGLACTCSCPMGDADELCKHVVALWITLLDDAATPDPADLAAWLADQPADRLRDLLLNEAAHDPQVHRRLAIRAAAETGEELDLTAMHVAITEAFSWGRDGYVGYRDAWAWRKDVESVIADLENLLDAGFSAEVVVWAELVLAKLNDAVGHVDDSDGHLYDLAGRTHDLHLRACEHAEPDPVELAGWLLDRALQDELSLFFDAVVDYAAVLGDAGVAAYRALARREWEQVPAIGPGADPSVDHRRFAITKIMEAVAELAGGLDEVLAVMQNDLASAYAFLRIAQTCRDHRRDDLALDWARRGLEAFPGDVRLSELLSDIHAHAGRHHDALEVERAQFAGGPSLGRYKRLKQRAEAAGYWPAERAAALDVVHDGIAKEREAASRRGRPSLLDRGASVLVETLLWEGDVDAAWDAAQQHGCDESLWSRLAAARAEQHPADALDVYRRQLNSALQPADKRAYDEVVRLLKTMHPLYDGLGRISSFDHLVSSIRTSYKRRPTLIQRLDRAGLRGVST